MNAPQLDDHATRRASAFFLIHALTGERTDFNPFRSRVKQPVQSLTRSPFALGVLPFDTFGASSLSHLVQDAFEVRESHAHAVFVEILRQLFVFRHDSKVRRGPTFGVMFGAPLRGLGWLCLASVLLNSCQPAVIDGHAETGFIHPSHAHGFAWATSERGQTTLVILQPRTGKAIVTVSNDENRSGVNVGVDVPHITIDRGRGFVTTSTTHVHLLEAGAGLKGWRGCTSLNYLRDANVLDWVDSAQVRDVSGDGGLNAEVVTMLNPGCILTGPNQNLEERNWPWVPITEYLEPHPLGRAEWMVPLAWIAGDSAAGAEAFEAVETRYIAAANRSVKTGKRVFTGSVADGVWHAPGKSSFVAQWVNDAGGMYALNVADDQSNVALSLESMLELVTRTDAWVLVTYDEDGVNVNDVIEMDLRHAEVMEAVDEVWVCNTAEVDYFGEVVAHPEWVLEDLAALVQSDSQGSHGVFHKLERPSPQP